MHPEDVIFFTLIGLAGAILAERNHRQRKRRKREIKAARHREHRVSRLRLGGRAFSKQSLDQGALYVVRARGRFSVRTLAGSERGDAVYFGRKWG